MITCAISRPPQIPTASMRKEIPAAAPLDTPFVFLLLPPWLDGLEVVTGDPEVGGKYGQNPT